MSRGPRREVAELCPTEVRRGALQSRSMRRTLESFASHRAVRRTPLGASALAMMLLATTPSCGTPLAVAGLVVGTGSIVGGVVTYEDCDADGVDGGLDGLCGLGNAISFLLFTVGGLMVAGGGISLLVEQQ
jgi:hypothetical protein